MQRSTQNPVDATKFSSLKLTKAIFFRFGRTVDTKRSPLETHCCALDGASFKRYSVILATSQEMLSIEEISMYLIKSVAPKAFLAFGILLNVIFSIGVAGRLSCSNISINRDLTRESSSARDCFVKAICFSTRSRFAANFFWTLNGGRYMFRFSDSRTLTKGWPEPDLIHQFSLLSKRHA